MIIILVVSIGLNVGLLGALVYDALWEGHRFGGAPPFPMWIETIKDLSPAQKDQIHEIMEKNAGPIEEIMKEIKEKNGELTLLISAKEPDVVAINEKIAELTDLHARMQQLIVSGIIAVKGILTPEQQQIFCDHMSHFIAPPRPGGGPHRGDGDMMRGKERGWGCERRRGPDR